MCMRTTAITLSKRIALVTGASRGIGKAASEALAKAGAHVVLVARDKTRLNAVQSIIKDNGGEASIFPCDLSVRKKIESIGPHIKKDFGRLDILIGNAGISGEYKFLHKSDPALWNKVMDVNLNANFHLIRTLHELLLESDAGRVMFVTSGAAKQPFKQWGDYCVSKAALEALAYQYIEETKGTNICVNLIDPGEIQTDMQREIPDSNWYSLQTPESIAQVFVKHADPTCKIHGKRIKAWLKKETK